MTAFEIVKILTKKKRTLAIAESCTGGLVSHFITNIPGSSKIFTGGIVAYSNAVKVSFLGVPLETIKKYGAVSREAARGMAQGVKRALDTDIGAAITGIAGPGGGTMGKPAGLAYAAFVSTGRCKTRKIVSKGDRITIKQRFAEAALEFILENI